MWAIIDCEETDWHQKVGEMFYSMAASAVHCTYAAVGDSDHFA